MQITDLKVEHLINPIGLDETQPRFSYIIQSDRENTVQKSFCLTVYQGRRLVYKTRRKSSRTVLIPYEGEPLKACTRYTVKVQSTTNHGETAQAQSWFETGLMGAFNADFITSPEKLPESACPVFMREFEAGTVKQARLYITALGFYEAVLNGKRVGEDFFTPGNTAYNHRLQYQAYDITKQLKRQNRLEVTLATGWYSGTGGCIGVKNVYGDTNALACQLHIEYKDGTTEVISTDTKWEQGLGVLLFSEREAGEHADTRNSYTRCGNAVIFNGYDKNKILGCVSTPVRIVQQLPVLQVITTPSGKQVLDFGQNLTGFVSFTLKRKAGTEIVLKHCEVLDQNGEIYTANLRTAECTDRYILNGKLQTLAPHFTFHGFRYCQVEGVGTINPTDFTACVLHTVMEQTGAFTCSDTDINQLQHNILWSQKGNFLEIPTDCPQRDERLGWTGDAQIFADTAAYNMDVSAFFTKWMADLAAEQSPEKGVPHMVPDMFHTLGAAGWGDAATVIPLTLYEVYGDEGILKKQYPSMKGWVDFITSRSEDYLWKQDFQYGDWLGMDREGESVTGATEPNLVANAYYAYSAALVAKAAKILGFKEDARTYAALSKKVKQAFRDEYVTKNGLLVSRTQTACVLALHFDLVEKADRQKVMDYLVANLANHKNHMVTGFIGTPYICFCLSDNGRHDLAATLLQQRDYPSWLYSVTMGATTIWERWNGIKPDGSFETPDMNSFNHYSYGSVGNWLYRKVAGLNPAAPGYKKIAFTPTLTPGLTSATATLKTVYGQAACAWETIGTTTKVSCTVPCNTTAELTLPVSGKKILLGSGSYTFED